MVKTNILLSNKVVYFENHKIVKNEDEAIDYIKKIIKLNEFAKEKNCYPLFCVEKINIQRDLPHDKVVDFIKTNYSCCKIVFHNFGEIK